MQCILYKNVVGSTLILEQRICTCVIGHRIPVILLPSVDLSNCTQKGRGQGFLSGV